MMMIYFPLVFVLTKIVNSWCNHEICTANQWVTESVQCSEWCYHRPGVGNLLVVLCQSNVAKSLTVPTHPSPP